jgi:hypothetical protein
MRVEEAPKLSGSLFKQRQAGTQVAYDLVDVGNLLVQGRWLVSGVCHWICSSTRVVKINATLNPV